MASTSLALRVDLDQFKAKIAWFRSKLESRDIFERIDSGLLGRLQDALSGTGGEELIKISNVPTRIADEFVFGVDDGPIIIELEVALRALGFEFQDSPL